MTHVVIPAKPVHHAFITDSWVACDKRAVNGWNARGDSISTAKGIIRQILASPGVTTLVAVVPDEHDAILGWICFEPGDPCVLHYVYLRAKFGITGMAGLPILRDLVKPIMVLRVEYTHLPENEKLHIPKDWTYAE